MYSRFYSENRVISQLYRLSFPFVAIFAFYIQLHGKVSPGGGFQSGIVLSMIFIVYDGIFAVLGSAADRNIRGNLFAYLAATGVICYAGVGFACILFGANVFDCCSLSSSCASGRQLGIFCMELGVGLAVFGSMVTIYGSLIKVLR